MVAMADEIRALCSIVTKLARADLESQLKTHDSGISSIEHGVLRHLSHGVTSMAEISRLMGVAPSTLVYVVDGLAERELVKRGKDPKDRRREPLLLEKKGADLFATSPKMDSGSTLVRSLMSMTEPRRHELIALLNEFVKGLAGSERLYLRSESEEAGAGSPRSRDERAALTGKGRRRGHD
jgi:DNA-binding MarR family transcriptional regulator